MHTSIIYVTKKVIHWGANHPKHNQFILPICIQSDFGEKIVKSKWDKSDINITI